MTPWRSHKYLYPIKDYDNYDFRSPVNVWNTQPKYTHEMDKIKFLEFDVLAGHVLYVPPYWWYSIKFSDEPTLLTGFIYNSIMNIAANIPDYFLYFIQQQNIKTRVTKVLDIQPEIHNKKEDEPIEEKTPIQESIDIIKAT
jgi:ribosomal protein L16 Arg81 hydroxylase